MVRFPGSNEPLDSEKSNVARADLNNCARHSNQDCEHRPPIVEPIPGTAHQLKVERNAIIAVAGSGDQSRSRVVRSA